MKVSLRSLGGTDREKPVTLCDKGRPMRKTGHSGEATHKGDASHFIAPSVSALLTCLPLSRIARCLEILVLPEGSLESSEPADYCRTRTSAALAGGTYTETLLPETV
jgi:hypothetical protein